MGGHLPQIFMFLLALFSYLRGRFSYISSLFSLKILKNPKSKFSFLSPRRIQNFCRQPPPLSWHGQHLWPPEFENLNVYNTLKTPNFRCVWNSPLHDSSKIICPLRVVAPSPQPMNKEASITWLSGSLPIVGDYAPPFCIILIYTQVWPCQMLCIMIWYKESFKTTAIFRNEAMTQYFLIVAQYSTHCMIDIKW